VEGRRDPSQSRLHRRRSCWEKGITEETYYRSPREYGGMRIDEAKHPKEPEPGRFII